MTKGKMTKKELFNLVAAVVAKSDHKQKAEMLTFINNEIELLNSKSEKAKNSKSRQSNETIMDVIIEVLKEKTEPVTIAELMKDSRLATYEVETKSGKSVVEMTNQKLSSMIKKLKDNGEVIRTEDKKKAYFSLPDTGKNTEETTTDTEEEAVTDTEA